MVKGMAKIGRYSESFDQDCKGLIETIKKKHPNHHIFEMEAYYLYFSLEESFKKILGINWLR